MTPADIEDCFPQIAQTGYRVTSPQTPRYNCIAWAAGDTRKWWWPDPSPFAYWPPSIPRENTQRRFIEAFQTLGYEPCTEADLETGFEKVALYADGDGTPTHTARQLADGTWTSKLGSEEDIEPGTPDGMEGEQYGFVAQFLKRRK